MHPVWDWLVAIYLFLGGLGAGAFLVAATLELAGKRSESDFSPISLVGATLPGPLVALGAVLDVHVADVDREAREPDPGRANRGQQRGLDRREGQLGVVVADHQVRVHPHGQVRRMAIGTPRRSCRRQHDGLPLVEQLEHAERLGIPGRT